MSVISLAHVSKSTRYLTRAHMFALADFRGTASATLWSLNDSQRQARRWCSRTECLSGRPELSPGNIVQNLDVVAQYSNSETKGRALHLGANVCSTVAETHLCVLSHTFSLNKSLKERGKEGNSDGKGILFMWNSSALSYPVHYYTIFRKLV